MDIENLKLELKATINYDAGSWFTNGKETVPITKIYIANTGENDRNGFIGYLYEPRIWKGVVDIYKDVENSTDKYDYTKKLTGLEQGLVVYIKDDYRIKSKKVGTEYEVGFEIKNEVSNKAMNYKNLEVDEEIPTNTTLDNINEIIGY